MSAAITHFRFVLDVDTDTRADRAIHELFQSHDELASISRSQIQKWIEQGHLTSSTGPITVKDRLRQGAVIILNRPEATSLQVAPENIPLDIMYEDEHLVVVNKPAGLTVHPSDTQISHTLVNALLFHVHDLSGIGGVLRPGIVHRIDKFTSGAMVVTKTDAAHQGLSKAFAAHDIERKYWAYCYHAPSWDTHRMETRIGRHQNDRKKMTVLSEGGRHAISHFTVLRRYAQPSQNCFASKIEARLETGRTHQVRVHLNHLGHALLGDPSYGTPTQNQPKWKHLPNAIQNLVQALTGQALHAKTLGFLHPISQKPLFFDAPLPPALLELESTLERSYT